MRKRIYTCFPEGKILAFTCSYDDGKIMDHRFVEILNRYGIKATFHLNSDYFDVSEGHQYPYIKKSEVKSLYQGHEIACHSCSHITMTRGNSVQNINEIIDNRIALENICDTLVTGYSYPNGCYDQTSKEILRSCGIKYARTTKSTYKFELPQDFLEWHPTCHHNEDIFAFLDKFLGIHHAERLNVFYLWGHSYEFERDQTWNQIETFFQKATGHKNVWYVTNGELQAYIEASRRLIFYADQSKVYNPSAICVYISNGESIYQVASGQTIQLD